MCNNSKTIKNNWQNNGESKPKSYTSTSVCSKATDRSLSWSRKVQIIRYRTSTSTCVRKRDAKWEVKHLLFKIWYKLTSHPAMPGTSVTSSPWLKRGLMVIWKYGGSAKHTRKRLMKGHPRMNFNPIKTYKRKKSVQYNESRRRFHLVANGHRSTIPHIH